MNRRGMTLLELLIAIAVIVAVSSLVMPAVFARLVATRGDEAMTMIDAAIVEARALAAREGRPVRVTTHSRTDGDVQIVFEVWRQHEDDELGAATLLPASEADSSAVVAPDGRERGAYVHVELPTGCRVSPVDELVADADGAIVLDAEEDGARLVTPDRAIAVLMPDGVAVRGDALALITPRGRAYEMRVGSWVGGVSFTPWSPEEDAGPLDMPGSGDVSSSGAPARGRLP